MLIGTQIKSFLVPQDVWHHGYVGRSDLPPIAIPARDALDIERRFRKGACLRNESRRYTLCCERIQAIISELASVPDLLGKPILYAAQQVAGEADSSSVAYISVLNTLRSSLRQTPYPRVASVFFPPDHAKRHCQVFDFIHKRPELEQLFDRAAKHASVLDDNCTPRQCSEAFAKRHQTLKLAAAEDLAIVDVLYVGSVDGTLTVPS